MSDYKPTQAQIDATTKLDQNISVAAGAGSGKTKVLVERFLEIVAQQRASADNILAITFTRKAAREMRERLRKAFLEKIQGEDGPAREAWQKQLGLLDKAQITTIDSFCSKVLRENPVEANMDPNFFVREEYELEQFKAETIQAFIEQELEQGQEDFLYLLDAYGPYKMQATLADLETILPEILNGKDLSLPYVETAGHIDGLKQEALDCFTALVDVAALAGTKTKAAIEALAADEALFRNYLAKEDYASADELSRPVMPTGKVKEQVQNLRAALQELKQSTYNKIGFSFAQAWQRLLTDFQKYYQKALETAEYYSFGYISAKAVELLATYPHILQRYRHKYTYIMVDEFQDTNEEQKKLVYLLAGGLATELRENRLFVVGDAKQSIYRFRGADVSVFKQVRDAISASRGENIVMADNFRSTPQIMAACNCLFRDLLGEDKSSDVSAQDLTAHREPGPKPEIAVILNEDRSSNAAQEAEARFIAQRIKDIVTKDTALKYSDVAILLPVINVAERFGNALAQEGIAACITDGKGFYEKQEIVDCINLFTFGLNTRKDTELAGVLRSPYLGLSDITLTELFAKVGEQTLWEVLQQSQDANISAGVKKLQHFVQTVRTLSLTEAWDAFYANFRVETLLLSQEQGPEKLANVDKLRKMAVDYALGEGGSLQDFLARLALLREINAREQAATVVKSEDAVNIMTIHKSKGLEFPVVCLPSLQVRDRNDTALFQFINTVGLGFKVTDSAGNWQETTVFQAAKEENKKLDSAEKIRQLYVAMTRAEKYLVMSTVKLVTAKPKEKEQESWFDSLTRIFTHSENDTLVAWQEYEPAAVPPSAGVKQEEKAPAVPAATYARVQPLGTAALFTDLTFSATALQDYDICPRRFFYSYVGKMPGWDEERIGSKAYAISPQLLGLVVHKALELKQEVPLEAALARAVKDQEFSDSQRQRLAEVAEELLVKYCASPIYQEIATLPQEAEKSFSLPLLKIGGQEVIFTGSIDRLVHYADQTLGIVDFKTGHPPANGEEKQGYTRQLVIYALAAEKLLGQKVKKAQLHFLQNNTAWLLSEDRQQEETKLAELLREILQKKSEQDFKVLPTNCQYCPYAYFCKKR